MTADDQSHALTREDELDRLWAESAHRKIYVDISAVSQRSKGCRKCGEPIGYLARYIQINGRVAVRWVCRSCDDYFTKGDIAKEIVFRYGAKVEDLPVRINRYDPDWRGREHPPCSVCGDAGIHEHHWAPRALFPDWPWEETVSLCEKHHLEWHSRMREHGLRWPHETK